jgi:signal transduction histidine kinase
MLDVIILAIVFAVYLLLSVFVLLNNSTVKLNRVYAALLVTIPVWSTIVFLEDTLFAREFIGLLAKLDYTLAALMLGLFYWFCTLLTSRHSKLIDRAVILLCASSIASTVLGFTTNANLTDGQVVLQPQPGYVLFIALLIVGILGGLGSLFRKYTARRGREKTQITFVGIGLLLTIVVLILALMVAPRVFGISGAVITRIGLYGTLFFAGFSTYAVIRHKFLDIRLAIARTLSYAMVLAALVSFYAVIVFGTVRVFFIEQPTNGLTYVYLLVAVFLAFTYAPLKKFFDRITDKIFFHRDYIPHEVLSSVGDITANEIVLRKLATKSLTTLKTALKSEFASVYIFPVEQESEPHVFNTGSFPKKLSREDETKLFASASDSKGEVIVADQLPRQQHGLQKAMNSADISVIVKLETSRELVGHLFFGSKQNGTMYNTKDLQLLKTVGDELALAIQNSLRFKEISEFNEHLQQRIDEATAELQESNKKLQQLDEAKDEFISMASHQLRTPLTSVKGYLSMVLDGDAGEITPKQHKLLEEAYTSSQRMVYLIGDFLNVSRLKTGKFVIEMTTIDLAELIAEEIEQLEGTAQARDLKLKYDKPLHFPQIVADENKLRQVIMNFIDNAIFYSQPGKTVTVELTHNGGEVSLKVRDQGIGVPAGERHKLFTKFYRAKNARKVRPDGTGIGLFMAKKVIVAHGGSILFESQENKGSTFGFRLPIKQVIERSAKR